MLAFRPGELTRRYARGERARCVSPLALFLVTVFLMLAVFSIAGPDMGKIEVEKTVQQGLAEEEAGLNRMQAERARSSDPARSAEIDADIAEARRDIAILKDLQSRGVTSAAFDRDEPDAGAGALAQAFGKARQNPELLIYKLQANAYKFSWALIPISIPFLWVLFLHRRRYRRDFGAYDHLVFVTYSIAFMSLTLIVAVLLAPLGLLGDSLGAILLLVPPVHMFVQLRGAYGLSGFSAAWRTLALILFSTIALGLFATLLLLLELLS